MRDIDQLFTELRATEPYLPDNGFTAVVMQQLPRTRTLPEWVKNAIVLVAAMLGIAVVAAQLPHGILNIALVGASALPGASMQTLAEAAMQHLPMVLLAIVAFTYVLPYGALIAARRNVI
jgi:hypothetical protein